jgi:hypothetical protein
VANEILAIGGAAGFSGDRWDAAGPVADTLVARGGPAAIMFETLAERTLALAQLARRQDPAAGYEPALDKFLRPVLRRCVDHGIQIVGNFGAANPRGAAQHIRTLAREEGIARPRIAVVEGDDLSDAAGKAVLSRYLDSAFAERAFVSANAYLGAKPIADALRAGAQVVVTGRVADPALALGPAMAWYDWPENSWDTLARATMAGHLLECGAQVTGGYFADPGLKDVPRLHEVGFPIAEIGPDGSFTITKATGTGGLVDARTVKEQLLYEVHDPAAYVTPDVVADISMAAVTEVGRDRVAVSGIRGHRRPDSLKVTVCFDGGWLGEGEISYAGPNAEARARLAADVVRRRVDPALRARFDLIGVLSVFGDDDGEALRARLPQGAADVRLRVAAAHAERSRVEDLLHEVVALYTCGPAGGGGVRTSVTPRLASASCFVPRELVTPRFIMID